MVSFFLKLFEKRKNFEVDWSLEPTICILCGKKEKCECDCIKYFCNKCKVEASDCICLEEECKTCKKLLASCECEHEKHI